MKALAFIQAFIRSFFLQTLWNFERMQNAGFAFAIDPLLRHIHRTPKAYHAALRRHLGFFNAHPYLAPIVIGVMAERERAVRPGDSREAQTLIVLKDSMGGAFGAIGDHVLWGTWRPFCAVLTMAVGFWVGYPSLGLDPAATLFDPASARTCAWWWVGGFLGLFNAVHLWLRWEGLRQGLGQGPQVVKWLQSLHLQPWASHVRRLGLVVVAVMILYYMARWRSSEMMIWMLGVVLGTMILKRWNVSGWTIFYAICGASYIMVYAMKEIGVGWP